MARWKPDEELIGPNEHVGRRLFDEPLLAGAGDQRAYAGFDLRNFQEKRDRDYSLDRLGQSSVDRRVVSYLKPLACNAGTRFQEARAFNGWAVLRARQLVNPPVGVGIEIFASPIKDGLDQNIYHAHARRPEATNDYDFALHLRHLFGSYGTVERATSGRRMRSVFERMRRLLFGSKKSTDAGR